VEQVFRIERVTRDLDGTNERREITFGITSLPKKTLRGTPRTLLKFNREHWGIENGLHWVRDVTFDEDRSRVRTGAAAQAMASLRNVVISLLRLAGESNIARALRHLVHHVAEALRLIGL
jgi:hypothetical protein